MHYNQKERGRKKGETKIGSRGESERHGDRERGGRVYKNGKGELGSAAQNVKEMREEEERVTEWRRGEKVYD